MSQAAQTITIFTCASETPNCATVNSLPPSPVIVMAAILRTMGTDLGDDHEVIRVLIGAKFSGRRVINLMNGAIARAA